MENIIEVDNLVKKYQDFEAVKGISFKVAKGSLFAFLGENGAGKSTTINILCQVLKKTSGKVLIKGMDLDKDGEKIKKEIGIVFQNTVLDPILNVKENLMLRGSFYGMKKDDIKNRVKELSLMLSLDDILNRKYEQLSGGQKRRVDIARALISKPSILFLDEPTTGLDPQNRRMVWNIIDKLRMQDELTVFLTTHYMDEAKNASQVVVIDSGIIKVVGTPVELKNKYTSDILIWYTNKNKENEDILNLEGLKYSYVNGSYEIVIENSIEATRIITKYQSVILDYEVIKGDMDDVFLKVTGKALGE